MNKNPYMMLAKVILPKEMTEYFDLTKVHTDEYNGEPRIHLYLDEKDKAPDGRTDLSPNGFYEESCMNDYPSVSTALYFMYVVAGGRMPMARAFRRTGRWLPRALATLRSLRLF